MKALALLATAAAALAAEPREDAFRARVRQVLDSRAHPANPEAAGIDVIVTKLALRQDPQFCSRRLVEVLKKPTGDMFWMFPVVAATYLGRGQLNAEAEASLRGVMKSYMPFRGDTENHWLMYYASLYLFAQHYPNQPGSFWFTGKTSEENRKEAEEWILEWMRLTTTIGQGEYDCTHYIGEYLIPLSFLHHWADDPKMKQRARIMLEWLMADFAVESLDGIYVGAHARTDDVQVLEKWNGLSSSMAWILFGQGRPTAGYGGWPLYFCAAPYFPPRIIHDIATDRSREYVHYERKRTRHRWRFHDERNGPVYKTTYMRREYAVGSDQGGVLQPIQQHSWDVTWAAADPRGVHNTMFSLHPYSSIHELQSYFTMAPDFATEWVVRSKKSYDSEDKFLGGSPYEKIVQDRDTVIALYDIPPGARWPHINGFFSKDLKQVEEHASGWIFARGGDAWLAYRPLAPYEWKPLAAGGRRLYSPHLKNGTIVQAAAASEFADMAAFRNAVLAAPLRVTLSPTPSVTMTTIRGRRIEFTWGQTPKLDGKPLDYAAWKLFQGPFLNGEVGGGKLTLTHGARRRLLDINAILLQGE